MGIYVNGKKLINARFAEDLVLLELLVISGNISFGVAKYHYI